MTESRSKSPNSKRVRSREKARHRYSPPNTKALIVIASAIVILIVAVLFYNGLIGSAPKQVVIIIPEGAGENLHIGFDPAKITIVIGVNNTVVWRNEDNDWHTAHSNIPEFNSGLIESGASFTHVFERAGTFPYHCDPHPWMTGVVIVQSSSSAGIIQPSIDSSIGTLCAALDRILDSR